MMRGSIDFADHVLLRGWAQDERSPNSSARLVVIIADKVVGEIQADYFRSDLQDAGIGNGWHAFEFILPTTLSTYESHVINVRAEDGTDIPGSPIILRPLHSAQSS